jgi:hypothetical protein
MSNLSDPGNFPEQEAGWSMSLTLAVLHCIHVDPLAAVTKGRCVAGHTVVFASPPRFDPPPPPRSTLVLSPLRASERSLRPLARASVSLCCMSVDCLGNAHSSPALRLFFFSLEVGSTLPALRLVEQHRHDAAPGRDNRHLCISMNAVEFVR